jgi:hypothetical protein
MKSHALYVKAIAARGVRFVVGAAAFYEHFITLPSVRRNLS